MKRAFTIIALLCATVTVAHAEDGTQPVKHPHLVVSPATLDFAKEGGTATFKIENKGSLPLDIKRVAVAPDAYGYQVDDVGPKTLAPGEDVDVKVTFTPDSRRTQAFGGIQVFSNDSSYPASIAHPGEYVAGVAARANSSWLLTVMIFFPLLGGLIILLIPAGQEHLAKWLALASAAVPVGLSGWLFLHFDRAFSQASGNYGLQYIQHVVWIPSFNVEYFVGVDGLSITMVILTALVSLVAVGASFGIKKQLKAYFALFLLLETGMMGTFCALDFFLFYIFWEIMLLPMYFLIGIWGGPRKEYAAIKFFLYTLAGSVLMLLAIIALYYNSSPTVLVSGAPAQHTFDIMKLAYANDFAGKNLTLLGMS
ncbi:MAG: proton-conducting transporter membrane subunit, partial [Polyangia bacterium]